MVRKNRGDVTLTRVVIGGCAEGKDSMTVNDAIEADKQPNGDFLWGCEAISRAIGRNKRVTFWLLENGELKSPRKIRGRWMVARAALLKELGAA